MSKVVFRRYRNGEIIALFPDEPWSNDHTTTSYMHIGQHGDADYACVVRQTKPATEPEYRDLFAELRNIGYDDLRIMQRAKPQFNNNQRITSGLNNS